jgi:hypothetical protein
MVLCSDWELNGTSEFISVNDYIDFSYHAYNHEYEYTFFAEVQSLWLNYNLEKSVAFMETDLQDNAGYPSTLQTTSPKTCI